MADKVILNEDDFPSNSKESTAHEKVVTGEAITRKPSFMRRLGSTLFAQDIGEEDIKSYIVFDVIVPTIRDTIVDLTNNITEMIFYGSPRRVNNRRTSTQKGKPYRVSYDGYYDEPKRSANTRQEYTDYRDILLDNRKDAEDALIDIRNLAHHYNSVRVSELCEACGVSSNWTDNHYGWYEDDLKRVDIVRVRYEGEYKFMLSLPNPVYLD